jgi:pyroglutamyl-peptidase
VTTVLVTGFAPFDGHEVNASWEAVRRLEESWADPERLVVRRLPVSFRRARQELRVAIAEVDPQLVVCVGEAGGRSAVGLERVAVNLVDARIPDADGSAPVDVPVIAGAPAAFFTSLPVKACLAAVERSGVPVEVSHSAGTYVCNATAYALAHLLTGRSGTRGGFVHVPRLPEQVTAGEASLDAEASARALAAVVRTALDVVTDVVSSAGALS